MTESGFHFDVREWNGLPWHAGDVWCLRKGARLAICSLWSHPIGVEARIDVDGEMLRTEASRDKRALLDASDAWKQAFAEKGWM